ncbi:MAG: glycosyltransferase [Blastocatellia bacterium]
MPAVSVCIPTHNTARYLPQAIESVLRQDFTDFELVICDNASKDETPSLCRNYGDERIRYLRFEELTNQAGNFNRCLTEARGEFVTLLHADDFFLSGFLTDRVNRLRACPEAGFVFGAVQIVDADGEESSTKRQWPEDRLVGRDELLRSILLGCIVSPPSLMVRKSSVEKAGGFRTDLTWGHDWEWTIRLAEIGKAWFVTEPFAAYREHGGSGTAEILSAAKNGDQEQKILNDAFARLSADDERWRKLRRQAYRALSRRHMYFAEYALMQGQPAITRNNLGYAARADVTLLTRPTFWALLMGSFGPARLYLRYRSLRNAAASGDQL